MRQVLSTAGAIGVLNDIYNMSGIFNSTENLSNSTNETFSSLWEQYLPLSKQNSLWFSGFCLAWGLLGRESKGYSPPACANYCAGPLGLKEQVLETLYNTAYIDRYDSGCILDGSASRPSGPSWTIPWLSNSEFSIHLVDGEFSTRQNLSRARYQDGDLVNVDVRYCLVEEKEPVCKVGLMTPLLCVTVFCVIIKTILCIFVVSKLSDQPLVTPGDAIESFIVLPDPNTVGQATMSAQDRSEGNSISELAPGPRQWKMQGRYLASGVPKRAWSQTYFLCFSVLSIVAGLFSMALSTESLGNR